MVSFRRADPRRLPSGAARADRRRRVRARAGQGPGATGEARPATTRSRSSPAPGRTGRLRLLHPRCHRSRIVDVKVPVRALVWAWNRLEWPPVEWLAGDARRGAQPEPAADSRDARRAGRDHARSRLPPPSRSDERRRFAATIRRWRDRTRRAPMRVIVSSHYAAGEVTRELQLDPSRVHVCPPGRPAWADEVSRGAAIGSRGKHILFMGTLSLRKNVGTLLEAYARLRAQVPDAPPLVLAGHRTPASARWEARCEQPPLKGHVDDHRLRRHRAARSSCMRTRGCWCCRRTRKASACRCSKPWRAACRWSCRRADRCRKWPAPRPTPIDPDDADGFARAMRALLDGDAPRRRSSAASRRRASTAGRRAPTRGAHRRAYRVAPMEVHARRH